MIVPAGPMEMQATATAADAAEREKARQAIRFIADLTKQLKLQTIPTLAPVLPLLLRLNGRPMTLYNHFTFEEAFRMRVAPLVLFKTARQVGKTTTIAALGILQTATISNFTTLFVLPLFEQVRRLSTMFVAPMLDDSPVRSLLIGTGNVNSVLQRMFSNNSKMLFSFAFLTARRIRGIPADKIVVDEIQDLDMDHLPIIQETIAVSDWALQQFTGTPLTEDNTIQRLWERTSQAEWFIPCFHCTENGFPTWNIPAKEHHLEKMIGKWHAGISEKDPATICHRCGKPIFPRLGRWVARYPKRSRTAAGHHTPQIIIPGHYAQPQKWSVLLAKQRNLQAGVFWNEVMGESYDRASKLVTLTQLRKAATLGENLMSLAKAVIADYRMMVFGIDWGGGGESGESLTTLACVGLRVDGHLEVPFGLKLRTPHDHILEAGEIFHCVQELQPRFIAHDFGGNGAYRETILIQSGVPLNAVMPCVYVGPCSSPMYHVAQTPVLPRDHYRVDKTKTLQMLCGEIQLGRLHFFKFVEQGDSQEAGLLEDFLALAEEKHTTFGGERYRITRVRGASDDFAQAVNYGAVALWYLNNAWPRLDLALLRRRGLHD